MFLRSVSMASGAQRRIGSGAPGPWCVPRARLGPLVLAVLLLAPGAHSQEPLRPDATLPLAFVANRGQAPADVRYYLGGGSVAVFFTDQGIVFRQEARPRRDRRGLAASGPPEPGAVRGAAFKVDFVGANRVAASGRKPLPGRVHYLVGPDPSAWQRDVPTVREVAYPAVWGGDAGRRGHASPRGAVDLVYELDQQSIKYRLIVQPGGDPDVIALAYTGIEDLWIDGEGTLHVRTAVGELTDAAPAAHQDIGGERVVVPARFVPREADRAAGRFSYGFAVGAFDPDHPLVIDPGLEWSTLLGGSVASTRDVPGDVAVDALGYVYVTGETRSGDFPTTLGAYDILHGGGEDVFVSKLDPSGTSLVYSTYLGSWASDGGQALAVDALGAVYVVGHTASPDFPTTPGAFVTSPPTSHNVFVAKLDPTGSLLEYSTYLGGISSLGSSETVATTDIAIDDAGCASVTGATSSAAFPTTPGAFDTSFNGSGGYGGDAFVARLNPDGSALEYSTFLGTPGDEVAEAIALDASGNACVTGRTYSASFPVTPGAFDTTFNNVTGNQTDVFVAKLDSSGSELLWSTYLGGEWSEEAHAIAVDDLGQVHVAGLTASSLFPVTPGAFDEAQDVNDYDGFFTILASNGAGLVYSTFLGGWQFEEIWGLALDEVGNVYLAGQTYSSDFPTTPDAVDTSFNRYGDAFVTRIAPAGLGAADLAYSTFLGGAGSDDSATAIAVGEAGVAHVIGFTFSDDFPTTPGAIKPSHPLYDMDVFVAKLHTGAAAEVCTGGVDDDGDGLSDCSDPECCLEEDCWGVGGCEALSAGLSWRETALANAAVTGTDDVTLGSARLEIVTVTSGPFVGEGFFRGDVEVTIYGTPYTGTWQGLLFEKPGERRIELRGALTGDLRGTIEGHLMESEEDSGVYDRYLARWEIVRLGGTGTAIRLEVEADLSPLAATDGEVVLSVLQDAVGGTSVGDYVGALHTRMTRVAVASPASPLLGEGFAFLSYQSAAGTGEAWTHVHRTAPGRWDVAGALSAPLDGVVTGIFGEQTLPRTLALVVERAGLPPVADVELRVVGPRLAAGGQTVDYVIAYSNDGVLAADDVVVVAQLPDWSEWVSATGGGVYRADTHEAIWRLGTVAPQSRGVLGVRVTFFWELPEATPVALLAMYEHASPERDYHLVPDRLPLFDHAEYLAYTPQTVSAFDAVDAVGFAALRAADPSLDDLYDYAVGQGYEFLVAARASTGAGTAVLQALLADADGEPLVLTRVDGVSLLVRHLPSGFSLSDATGGMTWDAASDTLEQWGVWAIPGSPTTSGCVRNCIINKVPRSVLKHVSKTWSLLFKSWDCFRCVTGKKADKCVKCVQGLKKVPLLGEAIDISQCYLCCENDPECHKCTKDKVECGSYFASAGHLDAVYTWRCDLSTGEYEPFAEERNCGYTPRPCCIEGVPAFGLCGRIPQVCRNGQCVDPENAMVCGSRSFCEPFEQAICRAKDPNAKHGPWIVSAGQLVEYRVDVENVGIGIAYGVYVTDQLDEDLDDGTLEIGPMLSAADGSQLAPAGEYDDATRTVAWVVGELGAGEGGHATLRARVRANAPRGTEVVNFATVYFPSVPEVTPTNPVVSIIPLEDCANGVDDDADGLVDCDSPACDGACPEADRCHDSRDNDGDGFADCRDSDCRPCGEDCTNGLDDDGDGLVDCDSPACDGACAESGRCHDGRDNDDDGLTDCEDPDCPACHEDCTNGVDDDADGAADCHDDECPPCREDCTNGVDDDGDGLVDCDSPACDGACAEAGRCADARDNDGDGAVDCDDDDCCGDARCPACCEYGPYARGRSLVRVDRKGRVTSVVHGCAGAALCEALRQGPASLAVRLGTCEPMAVPPARLAVKRKGRLFRARARRGEHPAYALVVDCRKGRLALKMKRAAMEPCLAESCAGGGGACDLEACLHVGPGGCWCAAGQWERAIRRSGSMKRLKLRSRVRCPRTPHRLQPPSPGRSVVIDW